MLKTFYLTTAIDYTTSPPHIGHAYEKVLADVIARYHRLKGDEVFFLTGVDQHGQKVQQSAEKHGVAPGEFVAQITEKYRALWQKLDVRHDGWAATTDPLHKECVQGMLQRLWDEKQIYKDKQAGYYSVRQEQFLTDKERGPDGKFGAEWGEVEFREEENYYFKLSNHKAWLLQFLRSRPNFVTPSFRQTELTNAVEKLSGDLCISRPKSRLSWGIELPFDRDYVNYVWFDALTNYISFIGYEPTLSTFDSQPSTFREKWPAQHVIGKDIMIPAHGIYWPIMLHALGFPDEQMPSLLVHGWWNISGAKMSKSLGNIVDPAAGTEELKPRLRIALEKYNAEQAKKKQKQLSESEMLPIIDRCGVDAFRYYLMSDINTGSDADFSEERLLARYNSDLANDLGNLLNRVLAMIQRYRSGRVKQVHDEIPDVHPLVIGLYAGIRSHKEAFDGGAPKYPSIEPYRIEDAVQAFRVMALICNRFIEVSAPWKLAKLNSDEHDLQLDAVLYALADVLRVVAILISPILPKAAHGIFDQLQWKTELSGKEERFRLDDAKWGGLRDGHVVGKPVPLFPRIEK